MEYEYDFPENLIAPVVSVVRPRRNAIQFII
jgi:hypothetical protein